MITTAKSKVAAKHAVNGRSLRMTFNPQNLGNGNNSRATVLSEVEHRNGQQAAINLAVEHASQPLTPSEILKKARQSHPRLSIATVYRTLHELVEAEKALIVGHNGREPQYESSNKGKRQRFICRCCQKSFDLGPGLEDFYAAAPSGFRIEHHDITLFGVCENCS